MSGLVGYLRKMSKPKSSKKKRKREDEPALRKRVEEGLADLARTDSAFLKAKSQVAVAKAALVHVIGDSEETLSDWLDKDLGYMKRLKADLISAQRSADKTRRELLSFCRRD